MNFIQYRIPSKLLEMTRNINIYDKMEEESDMDTDSDVEEYNNFIPLNIISNNMFNKYDNLYTNDKYDKYDTYDEELANIFSISKPKIKEELRTTNIKNKKIFKKYKCNNCNKKYTSCAGFKKHLLTHK